MALDKGVSKITIEMESALGVQLIQRTAACRFHHIYREKNYLADCLARWSYKLDLGICLSDNITHVMCWLMTCLESLVPVRSPLIKFSVSLGFNPHIASIKKKGYRMLISPEKS